MAAGDPLDIPAGAPEDRVDALYGLPLEDFTAARDALAAELRKAGERHAATWVKSLRKPSAPAWAVNQIARTRRRDAQRLVQAGDALREAHERVLTGRAGATDLRAAAAREAEAVRALREAAPGLLDREGHSRSQATLDRLEQTLQAVALEDEARDEFAAGRLTRERRATGLGLLSAPAPPAKGSSTEKASAKTASTKKGSAKADARARQDVERARRDVERARRDVERAGRELERARKEAERAQARLERAARDEAEARERLAEAEG